MTDDEICEGESIDLTATPVDCTTCTYQWVSNASNATDKTITVSPTVTTTYSVTVTNGTCCSDTTSVTIVVHPVPVVDLGPDMDLCPGDTISFDVTSPLAGCSYEWSTGSTDPTIDITTIDTYSVTTTCTGNCTATDMIVISPGDVPNVDLGADEIICEGDTYQLDAGNGVGTYLWSTGATTQTLTVSEEDEYCVTVTSTDGCTSEDCILIDVDTCLLYTSPSPRDLSTSRMPSSA